MQLRITHLLAALALAIGLSACGSIHRDAMRHIDDDAKVDAADKDPMEGMNRAIFKFNEVVDTILLKPVAKLYVAVMPDVAQQGVHNVLTNLTEPVTFVNSIFQADEQHTFETFWRFTINSTVGIAGLFDVAGEAGLKHRKEDFGQTMGVYGMGSGPYVVLPVIGPSSGRDTIGLIVDIFSDPFVWIMKDWQNYTRAGVTIVDKRAANLELLDDIYRNSLDPYATIRSAYLQKRIGQIRNISAKKRELQ